MPKSKATSSLLRFVAAGQSLIRRDVRNDSSKGWRRVQEIIRAADVSFTNYEGTLQGSYGGWPMKDGGAHASDPVVLDALKAMGFNALSLSNNHAFDWGPGGILSTLEEVRKRGFLHAGIGAARSMPHGPASWIRTRAGLRWSPWMLPRNRIISMPVTGDRGSIASG